MNCIRKLIPSCCRIPNCCRKGRTTHTTFENKQLKSPLLQRVEIPNRLDYQGIDSAFIRMFQSEEKKQVRRTTIIKGSSKKKPMEQIIEVVKKQQNSSINLDEQPSNQKRTLKNDTGYFIDGETIEAGFFDEDGQLVSGKKYHLLK